MTQDRLDGVKRSHTTDNVNEILYSDNEELDRPYPQKIEKPESKEKPSKKQTKTKSSVGSRKSSRKTTKEVKTENVMEYSD